MLWVVSFFLILSFLVVFNMLITIKLRAKGQPSPYVSAQPVPKKISPPASEWNYMHQSNVPASNYTSPLVSEYGVEAVEEGSALEEGSTLVLLTSPEITVFHYQDNP